MPSSLSQVEIIAPHFKRRLSGVTSTVIQLVPVQNALGQKVITFGPGLPSSLPSMNGWQVPQLWKPPSGQTCRVWHARRNIEMLPGIILRDVFRMPIRLLFTSASQRHHSGWTKWLISRMDGVIAVCQKTASYLERESTVILHGIDLERFSPAADKATAKSVVGLDPGFRYIGCFGRVRHQKGTDLFVDAMARLLPSQPGWKGVIAGRATAKHLGFEEELKQKVKAAGLSDRILFVGEHTNIPDWYRALDLFVAPQRWEGFGLTPLEAMASAVPVIASDVGAFPELVVEGRTGHIVGRGSVENFVKALAPYLEDEERLARASHSALAHARQNFSVEGEARAIGEVYARLLARG